MLILQIVAAYVRLFVTLNGSADVCSTPSRTTVWWSFVLLRFSCDFHSSWSLLAQVTRGRPPRYSYWWTRDSWLSLRITTITTTAPRCADGENWLKV